MAVAAAEMWNNCRFNLVLISSFKLAYFSQSHTLSLLHRSPYCALCYLSSPGLLASCTPCYFSSFKSLKSTISTSVNSVEGPLTYQHPLSYVPVPPPSPLYSCCSPWTVILKRLDIDRHINQWLSIALPPMASSSELAELQFLSGNGAEAHASLSCFFILRLKPSYIRPPLLRSLTFD